MRSIGSEVLASLGDFCCCLLCAENVENAMTLECDHSFCAACLATYCSIFNGIKHEQTGVFISCPTCRNYTKLPGDDVSSLAVDDHVVCQKAMRIRRKMSMLTDGQIQSCDLCAFKQKTEDSDYYCSKCALNFCSDCKQLHCQNPLLKNHPVIHISNKETISLICESHNKLACTYFCLDCNTPNCTACVLHTHSAHKTVRLHDALTMKRDQIKLVLNNFGPKLDKVEFKLKKIRQLQNGFSANSLHPCESSGILKSSSGFFEDRFTPYNLSPLLSHSPTFERGENQIALKDLTANGNTPQNLCESGNMWLSYCQIEQLKKLFDLASKVLETSQSRRLLAMAEDIKTRLQSTLEIELVRLCEDADTQLNRLLGFRSSCSGSSISYASERVSSLSSTSSCSSNNDLCDDYPQQSILMKPKAVWKTEKHKNDPGELMNPSGIAFLPDGNIVVSECDITHDKNNRIHIFDPSGKMLRSLAQGQIRPLGLAVTKSGNIAVTDCLSKRIKIFTPTGHLITEWGKGQFGWPYGIAINSKGQFIISDAFNDTISVHAPDGKRLKQWGSSGSGANQFKNPYHVAVDHEDNVIVSDCGNHCIKVFNPEGKLMFRASETRKHYFDLGVESKPKKRKLRSPRGVCVDMKGNILVADDCSRVCMFDSKGKYVRNLLTEEDSVKYAEKIAISSGGSLAITEHNPHNMFSVKVFTLYE